MERGTLKIHGAKFIITVDPMRRIISDGSILIEGNRITRVGKALDMADVAADRVIDASEMVVTPGFVNGHMHISYAHATRGIFPDDLGRDYLPNVFRLQSSMTEQEEHDTSLLGITELLKHGTTCFVDPGSTKHIDACLSAYETAGCRIVTGAQVTDRPNPVGVPVYETAAAIDLTRRTIERYDGALEGRVRAWAMPFAADYASRELMTALKRIADEHGTGLTTHQSNAQGSIDYFRREHGMLPVEYMESIGVVGPNVLMAHVIGLDDAEIAIMGRTDTRAVMCPPAALKSGHGIAEKGRLPELLAAGVSVGLGSDAGNNSNLLDTMRAMYLAAIVYKDARQDPKMIPAETAVELATINGARALGLDADIGSIEAGKKADLVLFDTRRAEWRTLFNPVNNLVYNADGRSVHTVLVDGRVVVENYKPTFVDEWALIQKVQAIGEDMLRRTGISFPPRWPVV
jgi:cytosine/adenosine deaminase-related metal-dependent hydrolase